MKKYAKFFLCLLASVAIIINSCKKDNLRQGTGSAVFTSTQISAQEIMAWYAAFPQGYELQPQWGKATKSTNNGQDVVQVPVSDDAALFFTKVNGSLNVFIFKWLNKLPGSKGFTGDIMVYSFQTNKVCARVYNKGILTKSGVFDPANPPASSPSVKTTSVSTFKTRNLEGGIGGFIDMITCVASGGRYTGFKTPCSYSDGWGAAIGNFFDNSFGQDGSNSSTEGPETVTADTTFADGTTETSSISISADGSGGSAWYTIYPPCNVNSPGDGLDQSFTPDGGTITPSTSGDPCPTATTTWVAFPIYTDPAVSDPNFNLSNYVDINTIDYDLNDVSVLPDYTNDFDDDHLGYSFDALTDANFVDIIIDQSFSSNAKLNSIYNTLKNNYTIQKILSKFFGKKNPISLEFQAHPTDPNSRAITIPMGATGNPYSNRIIIVIDPVKASLRPDLMVVKSIIHEIIHAEIFRILRLGNLNILPSEYNKILNNLLAYYKAYPLSNPEITNKIWDHGFMAEHYLSTIAKALQEYDNNPNIPLCFYKMLAWEGLQGTPFWNKLSASDRLYIQNAIDNYVNSQTITPCLH